MPKIYLRSVYEDQGYHISFGTDEDVKNWRQQEEDWIAQDLCVESDKIEEIGSSTDKNIHALIDKINEIIREVKIK